MADEFKFDMTLKLSMERISMISIAEILWKLPDVTREVDLLIDKGLITRGTHVKRVVDEKCPNRMIKKTVVNEHEYFERWEELLDIVLDKVASIPLSKKTKTALQETITLMGERIYTYYGENQKKTCKWCQFSVGTMAKHHYYFTSQGILKEPCLKLHSKYDPKDDDIEQRLKFFHIACKYADEEIVKKYQDEMIAHLESVQPGLNLKDKKDIVFNIICAWNVLFRSSWAAVQGDAWYRTHFVESLTVDTDYIIYLERVVECIIKHPKRSRIFEIRASLFCDLLADEDLFKLRALSFRKYWEFPKTRDLYFALQFLSQDQMSNYLKESEDSDVIMQFLLVWPYLELVPQILDFYFEKDMEWSIASAFAKIILAIGIENRIKHGVKKPFYLELFRRVWFGSPNCRKAGILAHGISTLIQLGFSNIKLIEQEFNKNNDDFEDIEEQCEELLKVENSDEFVTEFVSGLVVSPKDYEKYREIGHFSYSCSSCSSCDRYSSINWNWDEDDEVEDLTGDEGEDANPFDDEDEVGYLDLLFKLHF